MQGIDQAKLVPLLTAALQEAIAKIETLETKVGSGGGRIMAGYVGNAPLPQATQTRDLITATAGQTTFPTGGYTPQFLDVHLNGILLVNGTDYICWKR